MQSFGAKIFTTLLLAAFSATQVIPVAAAFFSEDPGQCARGCGAAYCCSPAEASTMGCHQAAAASWFSRWVSCQSFKTMPMLSLPWSADLFAEWSLLLSAPSVHAAAFFDPNTSQFSSLVIAPPDGPPWPC